MKRLHRRLLPCVAVLLAAGACAAPAGEPATGATPSDTATATAAASPATTPTTTPSQTPTASPTPTPTPTPAAKAAVDCAVAQCIALTYDDGPSTLTPQLLDAFTSRGATATLFVLGNAAQAHPEIVKDAAARGFEIGSHSYSHPMLGNLSDAAVADELARTNAVLTPLLGHAPTLLRPPYASRTSRTDAVAGQHGLAVVVWDTSPEDWVADHQSTEAVTRLTLQRASRNAIILAHDIHPWTVSAAPAIIDGLQARGYTLVTVTQLLGTTTPGVLYPR